MKHTILTLISALAVICVLCSFTITAHTGAYNTPDNTMEFILTALAKKPAIIEIDIRMRPDGTIVMSHDDLTSDDGGEEVSKVFRLLRKKENRYMQVNLDIKDGKAIPALYKLVKSYRLLDRVFMTGVRKEYIEVVKSQCPGFKYFGAFDPDPGKMKDEEYCRQLIEELKAQECLGVNTHYSHVTPELAPLLHENGFQLSVWTVNDPEIAARIKEYGADNITSRTPDKLF